MCVFNVLATSRQLSKLIKSVTYVVHIDTNKNKSINGNTIGIHVAGILEFVNGSLILTFMSKEENTTATQNATQIQSEIILNSICASLGKSCHAEHTLYLNTDLSTQLL